MMWGNGLMLTLHTIHPRQCTAKYKWLELLLSRPNNAKRPDIKKGNKKPKGWKWRIMAIKGTSTSMTTIEGEWLGENMDTNRGQ